MKHRLPAAMVVLAMSLASAGAAAQGDGRYVAGGLVGTFLGFGLGHAVNGRYGSVGVALTVGELVGAGAVFGSLGSMGFFDPHHGDPLDAIHLSSVGITVLIFGGLTFSTLRIFEIVDVWREPAAIAGAPPATRVALLPWLGPEQRGLQAVLCF